MSLEEMRAVAVGVVAEHLGCSNRQVQLLAEQGVIPKPTTRGQYDLVACIRAWMIHKMFGEDSAVARASPFAAQYARDALSNLHSEVDRLEAENERLKARLNRKRAA